MSAKVMGAVMSCGPKKVSVRFVLVAIADNSDDYGFACLSIETIADKACCSNRTAVRLVDALERDGWMSVRRHVFGGRGSVYYINIEKLGVAVSEKSTKSRMHLEVARMLDEREPRAKLSLGNQVDAVDASTPPCDNPQGVQVTKDSIPRDKSAVAILKNHCEPLKNQNNTPLPPASQGDAARMAKRPAAEDENENAPDDAVHKVNCAAAVTCETKCDQDAVRKVMRELNLTERRMATVIRDAIESYRSKLDDDKPGWNAVAERMVAARQDYLSHAELLKYQVGVKKFFANGLWLDPRQWVLDREELSRQRRL